MTSQHIRIASALAVYNGHLGTLYIANLFKFQVIFIKVYLLYILDISLD